MAQQGVILLQDHPHLGRLGDVVSVKRGYANYLVSCRMADPSTPEAVRSFEARRAEIERELEQKRVAAVAMGEKITNLSGVSLARKVGVDGKLFGSVGPSDVVQALSDRGIEIHKRMVDMALIKTAGDHKVIIELHQMVKTELLLTVVHESTDPSAKTGG